MWRTRLLHGQRHLVPKDRPPANQSSGTCGLCAIAGLQASHTIVYDDAVVEADAVAVAVEVAVAVAVAVSVAAAIGGGGGSYLV